MNDQTYREQVEEFPLDPSSKPSLWAVKPWWCQPWSIVLTGITIPAVAWWLTHRLWVAVPIGLIILGWWALFLYIVPTQYALAIRQSDEIPTTGRPSESGLQE